MLRNALAIAAVVASTAAAGGGVMFATAGSALAPEPAQLNANLSSTWQYATYQNAQTQTYVFFLSKDWTTHSWMGSYAGYPCANYNAPAGTIAPGYIVAAAPNWVRCTGW